MNLNNAKYYGQNPQMNQFTEELAELIQAVVEGDPQHVAEEIADVIVYRDGIGSVMGFFDHEIHKRWLDANTCAFLDDVTHWMEKPEDPEKTEEGYPE